MPPNTTLRGSAAAGVATQEPGMLRAVDLEVENEQLALENLPRNVAV
jgi:hypothetical protein